MTLDEELKALYWPYTPPQRGVPLNEPRCNCGAKEGERGYHMRVCASMTPRRYEDAKHNQS